MANYEPIMPCAYGALDPKVSLEPDFFTGFQPERRAEIVAEEAKFYHGLTQPYWRNFIPASRLQTALRSPSRSIAPRPQQTRFRL